MEYKGKLYGKVGDIYFPLQQTADDVDQMQIRIEELEKQLKLNAVMQPEAEKVCPKCGSKKVIMFDSDLDICKKCNHTF